MSAILLCVASILIVEDDVAIATLVADHLTRSHHDVHVVHDGEAALASYYETRHALLVLDVMLPKKTGLEVCADIRASGASQPVVLMLTARGGEQDAVAGFEAGADDYVRKPFGVGELVRRVEALLALAARRSPAPNTRVVMGELAIDQRAREVRVADAVVHLTPKELDLLIYLAAHPGVVLEREALLSEVWGYSHAGYARTVDSHVTRVRKKLAAAGLPGELIVTVHGVGYRCDPRGASR